MPASGPQGEIRASDVEAFTPGMGAAASHADFTDIPVSGMRQVRVKKQRLSVNLKGGCNAMFFFA